VPTTFSVTPSRPSTSEWRRAYPSIAELSASGTSNGETMSSASTCPSASRTGTRRVPVIGATKRSMKARALSTGIEFGS